MDISQYKTKCYKQQKRERNGCIKSNFENDIKKCLTSKNGDDIIGEMLLPPGEKLFEKAISVWMRGDWRNNVSHGK